MATFKICKKCNKCVAVEKVIIHEGGMEYIKYICPECKYVDQTTINHVHYGNDALK